MKLRVCDEKICCGDDELMMIMELLLQRVQFDSGCFNFDTHNTNTYYHVCHELFLFFLYFLYSEALFINRLVKSEGNVILPIKGSHVGLISKPDSILFIFIC